MELHVYYSSRGLLRVAWGPVITEDSIRRHLEMMVANKHYARDLRIITSADVEELGFPLTQTYMDRIKNWRDEALRHYSSVTTAFYNIKPVPAAYVSYFSTFFDAPNSRMKQFSSEAAAMEWLMKARRSNGGRRTR